MYNMSKIPNPSREENEEEEYKKGGGILLRMPQRRLCMGGTFFLYEITHILTRLC